MNSSIKQKARVKNFENVYDQHVPLESCRPFMDAWLQCVDNKDNCCGKNKCKFFFVSWQNCHKYNDEVRKHNSRLLNPAGIQGSFNGLSAK